MLKIISKIPFFSQEISLSNISVHLFSSSRTCTYNDDIKPSAELSSPCVGGPVRSLMPSLCHPSTCASLSEQILASSFCPGAQLFIASSKTVSVIVRSDSFRQWSSHTGNWRLSIRMHLSCLHTYCISQRLRWRILNNDQMWRLTYWS